MNNGFFAFLFRHELRLESRRWTARSWVWMYMSAIAVLLLVALAIWGGVDGFKPDYLLIACFVFPFFNCLIAYRMLKREWTGGTFGWWLSLPYSRARLLFAKFLASLVQSIVITILYLAFIGLLEIYNVLIHGYGLDSFANFLKLESEYFLLILITSPFILAHGLLMAAISKSRLKALIPLLWIVFGAIGNVFNWVGNPSGDSLYLFDVQISAWIWFAIPAAWLGGALLFAGAVKVCKKYLVL